MKALMLIDIQNDFAKKGGALYFDGAENVIPKAVELVKEFKSKGYPIIYTRDFHDEDDYEFKIWGTHCVGGTYGSEFVDELKKELEGYEKAIEIRKKRYSAFYETNLENILKELKPEEIHIVGLVTHICVMFTVEELRNRGYETYVHKDGVDSFDKELHNSALRIMKEVLLAKVI